jgi:hypothetical protein
MRVAVCCVPQAPTLFLGTTIDQRLNMDRLLEVLGFVLSHFTTGPDARRLEQLLRHRSRSGGQLAAPAPAPNMGAYAAANGGAAAAAAQGMAAQTTLRINAPGIGVITFQIAPPPAWPGGQPAGSVDPAQQQQQQQQLHPPEAPAPPPPHASSQQPAGGAAPGVPDTAAAGGSASSSAASAQEPAGTERLAKAAVLAPISGILVALAAEQQQQQQRAPASNTTSSQRSFISRLAAAGDTIQLSRLQHLLLLDWAQLQASRAHFMTPRALADAQSQLMLAESMELRADVVDWSRRIRQVGCALQPRCELLSGGCSAAPGQRGGDGCPPAHTCCEPSPLSPAPLTLLMRDLVPACCAVVPEPAPAQHILALPASRLAIPWTSMVARHPRSMLPRRRSGQCSQPRLPS